MSEKPIAILFPGWEETRRHAFFPSAGTQFAEAGYEIEYANEIPRKGTPSRKESVAAAGKIIAGRKKLTIIAHSFYVRMVLDFMQHYEGIENFIGVGGYLETITDEMVVEKPHLAEWQESYSYLLNFPRIRKNGSTFLGLYSTNDPWIPNTQADIFRRELGSVFRFDNKGHFDTPKTPLPINPTEFIKRPF